MEDVKMGDAERIFAWGSLATVVIGAIGKFVYGFMKTRTETNIEINQKSFKEKQKEQEFVLSTYKEIIEELQADVARAKEELKTLFHEHISCREENARMQTKLSFFEEKISNFEKKLNEPSKG